MEKTLEQRLFKCLLSNSFFNKARKLVSAEVFSGNAKLIFNELERVHTAYTNNILVNDLRALVLTANPTLTLQNRRIINSFFDSLETEPDPNEEMAFEILRAFRKKQLTYAIGKKAYEGINTDADVFLDIQKLAQLGVDLKTEESFTEIPTDLDYILNAANPINLFKFRLASLRAELSGCGRGNFLVGMGRPEVGKSSFFADCSIGWLEQGLTVHYFGNEEPAHKIILNHVRSKFNLTDSEIRSKIENKTFNKEAWNLIRANFKIYDCVGMSLEELNLHAQDFKPDIIIADQLDKFRISGNFGTKTEYLKELYVASREIAKRNSCLVVALCQASADAQDHRYIDYSMADMSKTGKAGEADMFLGIGKDPGPDETFMRYLTISKNKIDGVKKCWEVLFRPDINKWESL